MLVPLLLAALALQDPAAGGGATPAPAPGASTTPAPPPAAPPAPRASRVRPVAPVPPVPPAAPRPELPRVEGPLRGSWPATPSGKSVTLDDEVSLDDAVEQIAHAAGWNVVLNTGRTGNRTLVLRLRNVPVEEALRAAIAGTGLVATRTGDTVVVAEADELPGRAPAPALSGFDQPTGKKITAEFQETPVADALRQIAKAGGLSIVLPPGDHGTFTAQFRDVPVEDALRAVLTQANLTAERQGALVVVKPGGPAGFPFLPPGLGREARRAAEQAMREAEREMRRAERNAARPDEDSGHGRDRQQTGGDLTIAAGDQVRDVNVVRGNLLVQGGAAVRDVSVVSGSVHLMGGAQARGVHAVLGGVKLEGGASAREVVAVGGDVDIGPGAEVEKDVISIGGRVHVDPEADVGGSSRSIPFPTIPGIVGTATSHAFGGSTSPLLRVFETLVKFVVMFVLGLLVLSLFPRRLEIVAGSMVANPLKAVLAGLLGTVTMPVLMVLLAVTVVGILLIPVQIIAVIAAGVLGVTALVLHLGRSLPLPADRRTTVVQLAVGTAVFAVVTAIPFIGAMVWIAVWLLTFGAVLRSRFGQPGTTTVLPTTPVPPAQPV
jgi:hypothetical protein